MAITWTRLHEVLGVQPGPLTYAHVRRAVDQKIAESSGLDWKERRPSDENGKDELGKDAAAMANSGGGLIVYGVGEGPAPDKHPEMRHLDITPEQTEQQIRGIISTRVRPYIAGIEVERLADPDDDSMGVVAVSIPASPDAPHFCEKNNQLPWAPRRNGSHTEPLREHDIESAYRDRFQRRDVAGHALDALVEGTRRKLALDTKRSAAWCIAVASPLASVPVGVRKTDSEQVREVIDRAKLQEYDLIEADMTKRFVGSILGDLARDPRTGLRRWVLRHRPYSGDDSGETDQPYAELHHNGAVSIAFPVADWDGNGHLMPATPLPIHAGWVEHVAAAAVSLTRAWQTALSIRGYTMMRATVAFDPGGAGPLRIVGQETRGFQRKWEVPAWTHAVEELEPVDVLLDANPTTDTNRSAAVEVAEGVIHQFGFDRLSSLVRPTAAD